MYARQSRLQYGVVSRFFCWPQHNLRLVEIRVLVAGGNLQSSSASLASFRAPSLVLLPMCTMCQCAVTPPQSDLTSDESAGMNEDTAVDTGCLGQLVIAKATPGFGKSLAALEALRRDRHCLHAPLATGLIRVDHVDGLFGLCDGEVGLQLEEMLLRSTSVNIICDVGAGPAFQGAYASNRMILPVESAFFRALRPAATMSRAGNQASA